MMIAYKGFDKDLSCTAGGNRFQYELGKWNEETEANCAHNGFHCAEDPLDCLFYYPNWEDAVYYLVLADGDIDEDAWDSRLSCTRIKLVKPLNLSEFVAHSIRYICEHPFRKKQRNQVQEERGEAHRGFVVVRGKNPLAKGKTGDVLGLLKEESDSRRIAEAGIYVVVGSYIMADIWYGFFGRQEAA